MCFFGALTQSSTVSIPSAPVTQSPATASPVPATGLKGFTDVAFRAAGLFRVSGSSAGSGCVILSGFSRVSQDA